MKHLVIVAVQAVLTHSFFVSQWERPVAVQEYLLPAARTLAFPDVRACLQAPANLTATSAAWYRPQYFNKKQMMGVYHIVETVSRLLPFPPNPVVLLLLCMRACSKRQEGDAMHSGKTAVHEFLY